MCRKCRSSEFRDRDLNATGRAMKLYDYFRSSAAYRVRIALNLKGLAYERREVHLVRDGGEHLTPASGRLTHNFDDDEQDQKAIGVDEARSSSAHQNPTIPKAASWQM